MILRASAGLLVALLAANGCAGPSTPERQASSAKQAACRQRANEVYAKQNRADLYTSDSYTTDTLDSPYAAAGIPGVTTRGLSGQYIRETMISDCLNDAAGNVGATEPTPPPSGKPAALP